MEEVGWSVGWHAASIHKSELYELQRRLVKLIMEKWTSASLRAKLISDTNFNLFDDRFRRRRYSTAFFFSRSNLFNTVLFWVGFFFLDTSLFGQKHLLLYWSGQLFCWTEQKPRPPLRNTTPYCCAIGNPTEAWWEGRLGHGQSNNVVPPAFRQSRWMVSLSGASLPDGSGFAVDGASCRSSVWCLSVCWRHFWDTLVSFCSAAGPFSFFNVTSTNECFSFFFF